jgi:hypothetical protein
VLLGQTAVPASVVVVGVRFKSHLTPTGDNTTTKPDLNHFRSQTPSPFQTIDRATKQSSSTDFQPI